MDVTPASISNIVQGNSFPKPELLLKIAQTLDVDIRELFYPTKESNTTVEDIQKAIDTLERLKKEFE
ncbi:helix-turn-helix domain-containing protein [Kordia sp.]|uniref:helix-turn-helix domain-containing protein n=1 Tax=Kordia sp. TaxID=1965332 RepID=UPI003B5A03E1